MVLAAHKRLLSTRKKSQLKHCKRPLLPCSVQGGLHPGSFTRGERVGLERRSPMISHIRRSHTQPCMAPAVAPLRVAAWDAWVLWGGVGRVGVVPEKLVGEGATGVQRHAFRVTCLWIVVVCGSEEGIVRPTARDCSALTSWRPLHTPALAGCTCNLYHALHIGGVLAVGWGDSVRTIIKQLQELATTAAYQGAMNSRPTGGPIAYSSWQPATQICKCAVTLGGTWENFHLALETPKPRIHKNNCLCSSHAADLAFKPRNCVCISPRSFAFSSCSCLTSCADFENPPSDPDSS